MFSNRPARTRNTTQSEPRVRVVEQRDSSANSSNNEAYHLRDRVQRKLLSEADGEVNLSHLPQMRQMIETLFNQVLADENLLYTRAIRSELLEWVIADILGYGPLEPLLQDPAITEVMVNGPFKVYVERHGRIEITPVTFENDEHLMRIIDRIVAPLG
jgi:pilus assembly protein CpaF